MTREDFEEQLRTHLRRRPFLPFTVFLSSGARIEVDVPNSVAFGGGGAGYLNERDEVTFFNCEDVTEIALNTVGSIS